MCTKKIKTKKVKKSEECNKQELKIDNNIIIIIIIIIIMNNNNNNNINNNNNDYNDSNRKGKALKGQLKRL